MREQTHSKCCSSETFPKFDSINIHENSIFISIILPVLVTAIIQISPVHYGIELSYTFWFFMSLCCQCLTLRSVTVGERNLVMEQWWSNSVRGSPNTSGIHLSE